MAGWIEYKDGTFLRGTVPKTMYNGGTWGDDDWSLFIKPAPAYNHLAVNRAGRINYKGTDREGLIECEIEPPDVVYGKMGNDTRFVGCESSTTMNWFFRPLENRTVAVLGTWAEDTGHDGKTEIHPITSIFCESPNLPTFGTWTKRLLLFVLSDDSYNWPNKVPHKGESRTATFRTAYAPRGPQIGGPVYAFNSEVGNPAAKQFSIVEVGRDQFVFEATIKSGPPRSAQADYHTGRIYPGSGFYYADITLTYSGDDVEDFFPVLSGDVEHPILTSEDVAAASWERAKVVAVSGPSLRVARCVEVQRRIKALRDSIWPLQEQVHLVEQRDINMAPEIVEKELSKGRQAIYNLEQEISGLERQLQELDPQDTTRALEFLALPETREQASRALEERQNIDDQIRRLAEMRDAGSISSEEFDTKRIDLLYTFSRMPGMGIGVSEGSAPLR